MLHMPCRTEWYYQRYTTYILEDCKTKFQNEASTGISKSISLQPEPSIVKFEWQQTLLFESIFIDSVICISDKITPN